jgi:hypothetical protein
MTASRILVEFASCVIDLDPRPKGDLDDSRANLPSFTGIRKATPLDQATSLGNDSDGDECSSSGCLSLGYYGRTEGEARDRKGGELGQREYASQKEEPRSTTRSSGSARESKYSAVLIDATEI